MMPKKVLGLVGCILVVSIVLVIYGVIEEFEEEDIARGAVFWLLGVFLLIPGVYFCI